MAHRYQGEHRVRKFRYFDQFLSVAFVYLTYRESLGNIETCLRTSRPSSITPASGFPEYLGRCQRKERLAILIRQ
ncbi:MAG: DUF4372 domain-containing protein [Parachlamydiaceae bacterium]